MARVRRLELKLSNRVGSKIKRRNVNLGLGKNTIWDRWWRKPPELLGYHLGILWNLEDNNIRFRVGPKVKSPRLISKLVFPHVFFFFLLLFLFLFCNLHFL